MALILGLLWLATPGSSVAAPISIDLPSPCFLVSAPETTAAQAWAQRAAFTCGAKKPGRFGVTNWALIGGLNLAHDATDPWLFRHAFVRDGDNRVYFIHADGKILRSPTSALDARQSLSSGDVRYAAPRWPAPLTAILVRVGDLHSMHGLIPRAGIDTRSAVAKTTAGFHLFYGLFSGLLIAMLAYNLMLYSVLRHAFLLRYCLFTSCTLLFALSWSGGIFALAPDLTTFGQVMVNNIAISLLTLAAPAFMISYLEPEAIPARLKRGLRGVSFLAIIIALARMALPEAYWQTFDILFYGVILATLFCMAIAGVLAWRGGSKAIRMYAISWIIPFSFAVARVLWALGLFPVHNGLFDIGLFIVLGLEALISALGMVWRIGAMRTERDDARALEQTLRTLAETDPLTGLLNRRAFLDRARQGTHHKRLILVDIDHFKSINDAHGHEIGDQVIKTVAETLLNSCPDHAFVGRIGGEEFGVIVPADAPGELAYRLREAVETPSLDGGPPVTISAGVCEGPITDETDWRLLYIAADEALYAAKRAGRNRVNHALRRMAA